MRKHWLFSAWQRILLAGTLFAVPIIYIPQNVHAVSSGGLATQINTQRTVNKLKPLVVNSRLAASASAKAQHMLANGYWGHTAPDGTSPWHFVSQAGYSFVAVAENLARGFTSDQAVVSSWMGSAGHRANILHPAFRDVGVAVVSGKLNGVNTTLVVAHFGATSPASAPAAAPRPQTVKPAPKPVFKPAPVAPRTPPAADARKTHTAKPAGQAKQVKEAPKPLESFLMNLAMMIEPGEIDLFRR